MVLFAWCICIIIFSCFLFDFPGLLFSLRLRFCNCTLASFLFFSILWLYLCLGLACRRTAGRFHFGNFRLWTCIFWFTSSPSLSPTPSFTFRFLGVHILITLRIFVFPIGIFLISVPFIPFFFSWLLLSLSDWCSCDFLRLQILEVWKGFVKSEEKAEGKYRKYRQDCLCNSPAEIQYSTSLLPAKDHDCQLLAQPEPEKACQLAFPNSLSPTAKEPTACLPARADRGKSIQIFLLNKRAPTEICTLN